MDVHIGLIRLFRCLLKTEKSVFRSPGSNDSLIDHVGGETVKTKDKGRTCRERGVWEIKAGELTSMLVA